MAVTSPGKDKKKKPVQPGSSNGDALKDKVNNLMNIIDDDDEDDEELLEELQGTKKKFFGLFG